MKERDILMELEEILREMEIGYERNGDLIGVRIWKDERVFELAFIGAGENVVAINGFIEIPDEVREIDMYRVTNMLNLESPIGRFAILDASEARILTVSVNPMPVVNRESLIVLVKTGLNLICTLSWAIECMMYGTFGKTILA